MLCLAPIIAAWLTWIAPPDSIAYTISRDSRFDVQVSRAGAFSFLGHDHLVRARAFHGRAVYYPAATERSHIEIVVLADSLEVLTPPDTAELRKVTDVMRRQVLVTRAHPEVRFVSTSVTVTGRGFTVAGRLTLAGVTRPVTLELVGRATADSLVAVGELAIKQTDYGIHPVRVGAGMVTVADRCVVTLDIKGRP